MKNIEQLKAQITSANAAYRDGHPTMSDQVFDGLCDEFKSMMPDDEYSAFRDSLHEGKGKVKHPFIMGSLDKLKAEEPCNVKKFISTYVTTCLNISAKVDGISSRAHYEDGKLVSLTTRGAGSYGENITDKMGFRKSLPHEIKCKDALDVRGELVILKDDFEALNDDNGSKFANARNACAGIMNRKDWSKDDVSHVSFIAYTVLGQAYGKATQFSFLRTNGFKCAWSKNCTREEFSSESFVSKLVEYASQDFGYDTDGLVMSDSLYKNEDKYRPDAQVAFKTNQQAGITRLVDVKFEGPSKNGLHIPVAIVDPINLGGATVTRCTLHNLDFIAEKGLKYGSKVKILRSGDVIPKIIEVVENDEQCTSIELPLVCNCCGSALVRDGVNLRCMNKACSDQVVSQVALFIKNLGVKSASEATLKNFGITSFEALVKFIPDKKYKSQMKLHDELMNKMFTRSFKTLLCNMTCFEGVAEATIEKMFDYYGHDMIASNIFSCDPSGYVVNKNFKMNLLSKGLPSGVGEATFDKFQEGLQDAWTIVNMVTHDTRWNDLESIGSTSCSTCEAKGSICVTGSLKFGSRSKFLEFAKSHGYEPKSGVTRGLTYLITNDTQSGSSKNRKARELGVEVISEDDFIKLVNGNEVEKSVLDL